MKWPKYTGLIAAGAFLGLVVAEGLARLVLPEPTRQINLLRARAPDLQMDAGTDVRNPDYNPFLQRRPFSDWICDGKMPERMNNEGFRDRDFSISKDPVKTRIAILGDSFVEGWMGPREAAFPNILQVRLGSRCEVMNFGLANRSPLRYLALYDQVVRKYKPEIVLVCLYRNDPPEDAALRPYVTFDTNGIPRHFDYPRYFRHTPRMPQTKWEKRFDKWQWHLCRCSRLYPYVAVLLTVDPEIRKRVQETPSTMVWEENWRHTAGYLETLEKLVRYDGARFFLAYAPDMGEFESPDPLREHVQKLAKGKNIPFFPATVFMKSSDPRSCYLPRDGHFSPAGNLRYAEELAAWLKPLIFRP